jgi:peptidoglycan/LPS O-acetylase OafA/YrhL
MTLSVRTDVRLPSLKASVDYIPALEGMRAVAIILVIMSHASRGLRDLMPGGLGAVIFFVMSGFLITRRMIVEIESTGDLSLGNFYLRRFLRLTPALLVYIALFSLILGIMAASVTPDSLLASLLYLTNYYHLFVGYPSYSPLPILWFVSVE